MRYASHTNPDTTASFAHAQLYGDCIVDANSDTYSNATAFDTHADPHERNNLAGRQDHAEVMDRLETMLTEHMKRTGDSWDIEAVFPPPDFQSHGDGARYADELQKIAFRER